jgi:predicted nucleotidyltransferase
LAALSLRDRDAIITKEGLIFRVFGYSHPSDACICDMEYAPSNVFQSKNPKAPRQQGENVFFKFYEDEGYKFVKAHYPRYLILHQMLGKRVAGVRHSDITEVRRPEEKLEEIMRKQPDDILMVALHKALEFMSQYAHLSAEDFGVFGSILHNFYHPKFSDLDFTIYSRDKIRKLCKALRELYEEKSSPLKNEFETDDPIRGKNWRFRNYSPNEYVWHQRRKLIYSLFRSQKSRRFIKTEFEPVKDGKEIQDEYDSTARISQKGWVKMLARITEDSDAPFIPAIYGIEPLKVLTGARRADEVVRVVSYMEEFRMQALRDERVYVEGNLEEVQTSKGSFHQIALTYCPRYYEQVLKVSP